MTETHEIAAFALSDLQRGRQFRLWLSVETGLAAPAHLPVLAARGHRPGRTLVIVAGVHGNEYEGMEATRRVVAKLDPAMMHGDVLAIVVANPWAYAARTRETPLAIDGLNLARVFPGDPQGKPTQRLASAMFDLVRRHVGPEDLLLDVHSGTASVAFAPMVGFRDTATSSRAVSEEAARHMGLPRLWAIPDTPGPLNAETARIGIPTVGAEVTGRAGCQEADVAAYEQGLWNLLAWMEIVPDRRFPTKDVKIAKSTIDIVAPANGFARVYRGLHSQVAQDELLAELVDEFGDRISEVRAPVSGTTWAALESPLVTTGDLMFMIAIEECEDDHVP